MATTWTETIDNIGTRITNAINARVTGSSFYRYSIDIANSTDNTRDKFNPNIDDVLVLTITVKNADGTAVSGVSTTVTCNKGYFTKYNNTNISGTSTKSRTVSTNSSGQFTLTYKCSEWGIVNFSANTSNIQIHVDGWKTIYTDANYTLKTNNKLVEVTYHISNLQLNPWNNFSNTTLFKNSTYAPYMPASAQEAQATYWLSARLLTDGQIWVMNQTDWNFGGDVQVFAQFIYPKK